METIKGHNMILALGGNVIAASRECSLNIDREMIEIAGSTADAREYIPGRYGFTLSASGLYAINSDGSMSSQALTSMLFEGTKVAVVFQASTDGSVVVETYEGKAYVQNITLSGSYNERSTYSVQMQGTGALTRTSSEARLLNMRYTLLRHADVNWALVSSDLTAGYVECKISTYETASIEPSVGIFFSGNVQLPDGSTVEAEAVDLVSKDSVPVTATHFIYNVDDEANGWVIGFQDGSEVEDYYEFTLSAKLGSKTYTWPLTIFLSAD